MRHAGSYLCAVVYCVCHVFLLHETIDMSSFTYYDFIFIRAYTITDISVSTCRCPIRISSI